MVVGIVDADLTAATAAATADEEVPTAEADAVPAADAAPVVADAGADELEPAELQAARARTAAVMTTPPSLVGLMVSPLA
jgi:hypothetical protein